MAGVFRVIINGEGYDLGGAMRAASMSDWRAISESTGRNPFEVEQGVAVLGRVKTEAELAGPLGMQLVDTIGDLVFLARRQAGDTSPKHPDRPISYEEVMDSLSLFEVMGELGRAISAVGRSTGEDPTKAQTVSALGE